MILHQYNNEGYKIEKIHCDKEFKSIMDEVSDNLNVDMTYASTNDHVPDIERSNRTVEERYRIDFL